MDVGCVQPELNVADGGHSARRNSPHLEKRRAKVTRRRLIFHIALYVCAEIIIIVGCSMHGRDAALT